MQTEGEKHQPCHGTVNFEKRKHPRFSVDLPVEYYKVGSLIKHDSKAMNLSGGGLLLYPSEPLPIGLYVRLKLFLPSGIRFRTIETMGKVAWTDIDFAARGDYRSGVGFFDTSPKVMRKLKKFLAGSEVAYRLLI